MRLSLGKDMMDANAPEIWEIWDGNIYFNWAWKGCGFGQLRIRTYNNGAQIEADTECMSRESVRKILHVYADHLADNYRDII